MVSFVALDYSVGLVARVKIARWTWAMASRNRFGAANCRNAPGYFGDCRGSVDLVEYVGDLLDALYGERWAKEGRAVSLPELGRHTCGILANVVLDEASPDQLKSDE